MAAPRMRLVPNVLKSAVRLLLSSLALLSAHTALAAEDRPCAAAVFEGKRFTVCTADPARHDVRLFLKRPGGTFYAALDALPNERLLFATNAGMFAPGFEPAGLYVEQGKELKALNTRAGGGNFHLLPNGVFWIKDGRAHVSTSADYAAQKPAADLATQSGPMLVIDGTLHPKFEADGQSRYIRNGIGVRVDGRIAVAISLEPVSFGVFARLFRDSLACPNALYFDGSVSQLLTAGERTGFPVPLGPLLGVYTRK